jgi:large subunit ribosomal protein L9
MEIILLKNIEKVGKKFDIVTVKAGYGRNYLIPQGMAIVANAGNRRNLESYKRQEASRLNSMFDHFKSIADKIQGKVLKIVVKAGESGKIYGSVTNAHVAEALLDQLGIEIDKRLVDLPEHIKMLGNYTVSLDLHPDLDSKVNISVVGENGETAEGDDSAADAGSQEEQVVAEEATSEEEA